MNINHNIIYLFVFKINNAISRNRLNTKFNLTVIYPHDKDNKYLS